MSAAVSAAVFGGVFAAACAPTHSDEDAAPPVRVSLAPLANDDCVGARPLDLPDTVETVVVQRSSPEGWTAIDRVDPGGTRLLTGIDTGEAVLRFIACVDRSPAYATGALTIPVDEAAKAGLDLHFKPLNRLACTGTAQGQGPAYNRYAGLGRPRAFAVGAALDDGRVLVAGGADAIEGKRLSVADAERAWDVYVPGESLFLPGVERARPLEPRPMRAPRIGARAVPWRPVGAERPGVLIIGGAPEAELGVAFRNGPLAPTGASLSRPAAEYFDPETGSFAPLVFADGAVLAERFMPGVAADDAGRVVIVGGVQWPADAASDRVEVIDGDALYGITLPADGGPPAGLVGPTVTPIGDGRFFVWGGDVAGCGQRPGWLVSLDPTPRAQPLTIEHEQAPPTCDDPPRCRPWYSTGFHAAVRLADAGERRRILISGGLVMGAAGPSNNPDPGQACGANVFVAEFDPADLSVTIHPVNTDFEAGGALKRAFHTAAAAGGERVLLAGGWAFLGNANLFGGSDDVLFYRDARPSGTVALAPDRLTIARLGGLGVGMPRGGVLLAGGLVRQGDDEQAEGQPEFRITEAAEAYTPPIDTPVCAEGG